MALKSIKGRLLPAANCHSTCIVVLFVLAIWLQVVKFTAASIHLYDNVSFKEVGNSYLFSGGSEGLSSAAFKVPAVRNKEDEDSPRAGGGMAYIRFENITFKRTTTMAEEHSGKKQITGVVQIVVFEAADRNNIGGSIYGGQRSICCTVDLAKLGVCKEREVIRIPSVKDNKWPIVRTAEFRGNDILTGLEDQEVLISDSGMYNLFFITCDPTLKSLTISGKTVWKNGDGYLPGRMAPLKKFYGYMTLLYLLLAALWFIQYSKFWIDVLPLQHCITAVIGLGLFEMILWYADFTNFNNTGMRPVLITYWVVTIGALRKTLTRILVLCVSMGYGVVRPTLGGLTSKVLLLGGTYFLASEMLDITEYVGTINDISGRARLFLVLPDAFLDAFLIIWIFLSLSKTLEQLQMKRSSVKLEIYRKFANALVVTVIASLIWIVYEVYFKATDPFNEKWQSAWTITAFWDILAFALLCLICYLWAPSQTSQRYAYSEDFVEEDSEEGLSLTRTVDDDGDCLAEEKHKKAENLDTFDEHGDALEEDKRE